MASGVKKVIVLAASILVVAGFGCSKGFESQKAAGDLKITLSVPSYPLIKGDNTMTVKIDDPSGKAVTDANVDIRYYMPPMPGMAPMEYSVRALLRGTVYAVSANIPMEGGWKLEITVTRPARPSVIAAFNLDAR